MARINIEDSIWKDSRFQDLMIKVGSRHAAKGMMIELWTLAQEFWFPEMKAIPMERIQQCGLEECIAVGLANITIDGVFAQGTKEAFAWLFERQEGAVKGGKKSAKRPRDEHGRLQAKSKSSQGHLGESPSEVQAKPSRSKPLSPSLSLPLSSFSSSDSSSNSLNLPAGADASRPPSKSSAIWESYRLAYKGRYREEPIRNKTINSQLCQIVDRLGAEEAPLVADFFLTHNDQYYVKKMHPVGLLLQDAEKIRTEWKTGNRMLGTTAVQVERSQHNADVWSQAAMNLARRKDGTNG